MVEQFVGTWKMIASENFDDYMKAIGVGFATRQVGNRTKPNLVVSVDDQGVVCMKSQSTFKTTEVKFKLNEEFDETTADDRKTKTVMTLENGKLIQKQTWDGKETCIEREITDGKLIAVSLFVFKVCLWFTTLHICNYHLITFYLCTFEPF
uniref:Cellular retinoic acid-binding protein 1 n=1 Tax=Periophthalmus magnuspinnatus TaxID=409849 RepID=A0A3B4BJ78_9GOBI